MGPIERFRHWLLRDEIEELERFTETMARAYRRGPYVMTPESLARQIGELDSRLIDLIVRQQGYDIIYGTSYAGTLFSESDRKLVVDQARYAQHFDPQAGRAINAWTDFGFGQKVEIEPQDPVLAETFDEFWTARRNSTLLRQSRLDTLSNTLCTDGEIFLIFYIAKIDGAVTVRRLATEEINEVVNVPDDEDTELYYARAADAGTVWYKNWAASPEELERAEVPRGTILAHEMNEQTDVVMMRISYEDINGRGWPVIFRALPWYTAYKESLEDWAAVASAVAMFPHTIKHKGGSRATTDLKTQLQSSLATSGYGPDTNPPATPGATWIENEAATRRSNSLNTGAGDWQQGTMLLLGQATAGDGLPLAYRGRPDTAQNRSVAEVTTIPWDCQMTRYAAVWEDAFRDIAEVVGRAYEMYAPYAKQIKTYAVNVSVSRPATLTTRTDDLVLALEAIDRAAVNMTIPTDIGMQAVEAVTRLILERYGVKVEVEDEPSAVPSDEPPETTEAVAFAVENYRRGEINGDQLAAFLLCERLG